MICASAKFHRFEVLRLVLLVGLTSIFLFGFRLGELPLLDRDEPRFAEASREMLHSGDWIIPRLNGRDRFDKPPLIYWAQAFFLRTLGESAAAVRWPSALAAALTAVVIALWGRRIAGYRVGLWSAVLFATNPQVFAHAHLAVADMLMVLCVTLASWLGWEWLISPSVRLRRSTLFLGFFFFLALGFLAKGPIAWMAVIPLIWTARAEKSQGLPTYLDPTSFRTWILGGLLTLTLIGLWGVPALLQSEGAYFRVGIGKHVVERSVGILEGHGGKGLLGFLAGLPFYGFTLLIGFLPWSPQLVRSLYRHSPWRTQQSVDTYLLTGIASVFLIFTLIRTKLPHYVLPAFPWIALWLGKTLVANGISDRYFRRRALPTLVLLTSLAAFGFSNASPLLPVPLLAKACAPWIHSQTHLATFDFEEPSVIWYFRKPSSPWVNHLKNEADLFRFINQPGSRVCILPFSPVVERLETANPRLRRIEAQGFNLANGRRIRLIALVQAD